MILTKPRFKFLLVQGRALKQTEDSMQYFPSNWKEELPLIRDLGFDGIEWIYDKKSENDNPLLSRDGREQMKEISKKHHVSLENVVLDWFIFNPLIEDEFTLAKRIERLSLLIGASAEVGFKRIILPLLEQNSISSIRKRTKFIEIIKKVSKQLESNSIQLHLETSLKPEEEYQLLQKIDHDKLRICFDMGNSASYGYLPRIAINTIKDFLGCVHIKDRILNGPSVPLGQGSVKFQDVFTALKDIKFNGPYSFQVYRNKESDNITLLRDSLMFINNVITELYYE